MTNEKFFLGFPEDFHGKLEIYAPYVNDVVGNDEIGYYAKVLTLSQEEIEDELTKDGKTIERFPTPYEFLLANSYHDPAYRQLVERAFQFFCHTDICLLFEQKKILIGNAKEILEQLKIDASQTRSVEETLVFLEEDEFFDFQNRVRAAYSLPEVEPPNPNEDPRVKRIKAKGRMREKLKAKKGGGPSLVTLMAAICCMGLGITPLNIGEMTYVAARTIVDMYQQKEKYQLDVDSLLAGADSKKVKPKYWIQNLK